MSAPIPACSPQRAVDYNTAQARLKADKDTHVMAGRYFEDWQVGDRLSHDIGRTVTETDNLLFSVMTHNPQPLHIDVEVRWFRHTLACVVGVARSRPRVCLPSCGSKHKFRPPR